MRLAPVGAGCPEGVAALRLKVGGTEAGQWDVGAEEVGALGVVEEPAPLVVDLPDLGPGTPASHWQTSAWSQ